MARALRTRAIIFICPLSFAIRGSDSLRHYCSDATTGATSLLERRHYWNDGVHWSDGVHAVEMWAAGTLPLQ